MAQNTNEIKGCEFATAMLNFERETLLKLNEISHKYHVDTFHATETFAVHLIELNGRLKENFSKKAAQATDGGANDEFL